jgi:hypothetical protein
VPVLCQYFWKKYPFSLEILIHKIYPELIVFLLAPNLIRKKHIMRRITQFIFVLILVLGTSCLISCEKGSGLPVDGDGKEYDIVVIGTQTWLKENLKTSHYCGGAPISLVTDDLKWENCKAAAYCWYNNEEDNNIYGALYNWYVVKTGVLCPVGYHVPTIEDWTTLTTYLIDAPEVDEQGFEALSIGMRSWNGDFLPIYGWWVSASEKPGEYAWVATDDFSIHAMPMATGYHVRCIKDN